MTWGRKSVRAASSGRTSVIWGRPPPGLRSAPAGEYEYYCSAPAGEYVCYCCASGPKYVCYWRQCSIVHILLSSDFSVYLTLWTERDSVSTQRTERDSGRIWWVGVSTYITGQDQGRSCSVHRVDCAIVA